jgi:hypothetical protein
MTYIIKEGQEFIFNDSNLTLIRRTPVLIEAYDPDGKRIKIKKESAPHLWQTLLMEQPIY